MNRSLKSHSLRCYTALFVFSIAMLSHAQVLEPRAYANAPVGMNFLLLGYMFADGALLFDPALPITDANAKVNTGLLGYVYTLGVAGKSAKIGVLLPYAKLDASGYDSGIYKMREDNGPADPSFYFTVNLSGAPALSFEDFKDYEQDTIIGLTFKLTAPLGVYDNDKLINIGTNRWSFEPEIGISKFIGRWTLETMANVILYTDNDDFDNGSTRKQEPIYSAQGHVIYNFPNHVWLAIGVIYFTGGETSINGVPRNDLQNSWRSGFTLALPVNRNNSIKIFGNSGLSTRTGTDYDSLGVAWQYRWGDGL